MRERERDVMHVGTSGLGKREKEIGIEIGIGIGMTDWVSLLGVLPFHGDGLCSSHSLFLCFFSFSVLSSTNM